MSASRDEGWAVWNLDAEPSTFDFPLALGESLLSYRTGPSDHRFVLPDLSDKVLCRVSISAETRRSAGTPPLRRLEIVGPYDEHYEELNSAHLFESQFALALRLFKPIPFAILPWVLRTEMKRRASPRDVEPYSLRGADLRGLRKFAAKILDLHVDRARWHGVRYGTPRAAYDKVVERPASQSVTSEFLARIAHRMIALDIFEQAHRLQPFERDLKIVLLVAAAEALFSDGDKGELSHRLSLRMSVLNGSDAGQRKQLFELARQVYDMRSRLVHGDLYRKAKGFLNISDSDLLGFSNLVRSSLLYFIAFAETDKGEILRALDRAIFDVAEVHDLRFKANEYWGFRKRSEEHLYRAAWNS